MKDEGPDPSLDSTGAKSSEIRRLLESAESCIAREDWITAAQILKSALSLDRAHAAAAARLQFVQQQTTRAYTLPAKRRGGRWMAFGMMGLLGVIGALTVVVILLAQMMSSGKEKRNAKRATDGPPLVTDLTPPPVRKTDPPVLKPIKPRRPASEASGDQQMAGRYELTSYKVQGVALPVNGSMRLVPISAGHFRFEMSLAHATLGAHQYSGLFENQGTYWTMTTEETDDPNPNLVKGPIATQVRFTGSTLVLQSLYAKETSTAWRKHQDRHQ